MGNLTLPILLLALLADWRFGEPDWLWSRLPHPVVLFGKAVGWVDRRFNLETDDDALRFRKGAVGISMLVIAAALTGAGLATVFRQLPVAGPFLEGFVVFALLAQRSLLDHVGAVAAGLRQGGLEGGRKAVALIVGRDPDTLDRSGVARAAIESVAENFSDGVVAPAFWYGIFGLPGLIAYKMINTADSMIGYRTARHEQFGKAAAKIDDLANWLPARLSVLLVAGAALVLTGTGTALRAMQVAAADSGLHRSPNAGWPEGAVAGACGFALGGPRTYPGGKVEQAFINAAGKRLLDADDIDSATAIVSSACMAGWLAVAMLAVISLFIC